MIRTDELKWYLPLNGTYKNMTAVKSGKKGESFPLMHRHIVMIKGWLSGIHHQCKHLRAYLDEFNYRFNRSKLPHAAFRNRIVRLMEHQPINYHKLKMLKYLIQ